MKQTFREIALAREVTTPLLSTLARLTRNALAMSRSDKALFAEAVIVVAAVKVSLGVLSFRRTSEFVARIRKSDVPPQSDFPVSVRRAIQRASRLIPGSNCLPQALTAQAILQRRGLPSVLHIGVSRSPADGFGAHAWLEHAGRIVIGEDERAYSVIYCGEDAKRARTRQK